MTILQSAQDGAFFSGLPVSQGSGETDWMRYQARIRGRGQVLTILSATAVEIQVSESVSAGDTLYLKSGLARIFHKQAVACHF